MRRLLTLVTTSLLLTLPIAAQTEYVNPFIGTTNFGACNPGAVTPNGLMSVSPFNVMGSSLNTWDKDSRWWSTPYVEENRYFTGYAHVNLSGVGCPELGSLLTMPTTGPLEVDYHAYGSEYEDETARPGYYSVRLLSGIRTEATATTRTSLERYTFPAGAGNILVNLGEGLTNESGATVRRVSDREIEGSKLMGTFCYNRNAVFPMYFVLRVSKAPDRCGYWKKQRPMTAEAAWDADAGRYKLYEAYSRELSGDDIGYWFRYEDLAEGEQVMVQIGVSFVSIDNARENLEAEQNGFDFTAIQEAAAGAWQEALGRIRVTGGTDEQKTVFYTALYHALIHPNILEDVNGEYPLMEFGNPAAVSSIPVATGRNGQAQLKMRARGVGRVPEGQHRYTVFSLWDTCRNFHQLMTLVYPEKQIDMARSVVNMYREWGWMPKWELYGRETFTMEGDPAIPMLTDTYLKGLTDFDIATAYEAFLKSAETPGAQNLMRPDADPYNERGYIPLGWFAQDFSGDNSVSHALEYYMADASLARLAEALGHPADAAKYRERSLGYKHYWDQEYGCLRPLQKDGSFLTPFNPRQGENFEPVPGFHEGSAWNYTFYVPHDVDGLIALAGGSKAFVKSLDRVFADGLYDPANEPDIAYPYLYSRVKGEAWRTWKTVHDLLASHYRNAPDGIPGNDDTGTMSAWAVFSMMGFYPDCPGDPSYTLTLPVFDRVEIDLPSGKPLTVTKSPKARPAKGTSVRLAGRKLTAPRISHDALLAAGTISWQ
jgi:putative alpha-1,2-mannosidase